MYNSNLALQITDYSWTLPRWSYLVNEVADVFRLTSGVWNYQNMKNKLLIELNKQEIPNFDWILKCIPLNKW